MGTLKKRIVRDGRELRVESLDSVPAPFEKRLPYSCNPPQLVLIDGEARGWLIYCRHGDTFGTGPFQKGYHLFSSVIPAEEQRDERLPRRIGLRSYDRDRMLQGVLDKVAADPLYFPGTADLPAYIERRDAENARLQAEADARDAEWAEHRRQIELSRQRAADAQARKDAQAADERATIREGFRELLDRPDVTNYQREALGLAAKHLGIDLLDLQAGALDEAI